jgi:DNA repair exonuclease SbcCD nuclease subunit
MTTSQKETANNKVAFICDTHFGVRKGNQIFHDYFEKFYNEVFFPTLDERGIDTVVHLGDCFDVRKGIDYWSLDWAKRVFFNPLRERGIDTHIIVGNHDIFYKQSLSINSPGLNLREYENVTVYDRPRTQVLHEVPVLFVPWLCEGNAEEFVSELDATPAKLAWGHLELAGFHANKDYICNHGTDAKIFSKFDRVFSGHFHKKSTSGNVTYLGNPYQIYWNDEGDTRGFHIFDMETYELEYIKNPYEMFHKVYYNEDKPKLINPKKVRGSFVKLIVEKSTPRKLSTLVDKLYEIGLNDLKIIETQDLNIDEDVEVESEDTLTTLTNYVMAMEDTVNKESVVDIFKSLYVEAQEV